MPAFTVQSLKFTFSSIPWPCSRNVPDPSCTDALCQVLADHRGSGPSAWSIWKGALEHAESRTDHDKMAERKRGLPLEMVKAGDH